MKKMRITKRQSQILLICLFYLVISLLMYFFYRRNFIWNGDDSYFHFQRIEGLSANFTDGLLSSNFSPNSFGIIGYGIHIFYPWITLMPFNLMHSVTGNWVSAFYLALGCYFFLSLLISHYSMKKFSGSTKLAFLFAIIYNFSTYRLIDLFTRAAWAEYLSTIFLPLCFLGFYEIFFGDGKQWKPLAIGLSGIIFSHILSTYLCVIMFVILLILFIPKIKFSKMRFFNFLESILATVLSTLIFTLPFLSEELFQTYKIPDPQKLKGQNLQDVLYSSFINSSKMVADKNTYNVGLSMIIIAVLGVIVFIKFSGVYKSIFVVFIASFLLATDLFPWNILQDTIINVIQFPYRLFMFTTLFGSIVGAKALGIIFGRFMNNHFPIFIGIATVLIGGLWFSSINDASKGKYMSYDGMTADSPSLNHTDNFPAFYLNQYIPKKSQKLLYTILQHDTYINGYQVVQTPKAKNNGNELIFNEIKKGDVLDVPLIRYKYTNVSFNGNDVTVKSSKRGTAQIIAPTNAKKAIIHISYGNRKLFGAALILSIIGWIWLVFSVPIGKLLKKIFGRKTVLD